MPDIVITPGSNLIQASGGTFVIESVGDNRISLKTNNSNALDVSSGGNFGIGTTNPLNTLMIIQGGEKSGINLSFDASSNNRTGLFAWTRGSSLASIGGGIEYTALNTFTARSTAASYVAFASGETRFYGNTGLTSGNTFTPTERLCIDSSGNVGIGTTSPSTRLQIEKSSQTLGSATPSGAVVVSNLNAGNGVLELGSDSTNLGYIQSRNITSQTYYQLLLNPSGGCVGIGTTSPNGKLTVLGDGSQNTYSGVLRIADTATNKWAGIGFPDTQSLTSTSNNYYLIGRGGAYTDRVMSFHIPYASDYGSGAQPKFGFYSTGADLLCSIEASTGTSYFKGNVGIGTTSPGALLDLYSSASRIKFNRGASYSMSFGMHDSTNSALSIKNFSDASTIAYFQYDGNVGIGTTSPTAKLHVAQTNSGGIPAIRLSEDESTIQGPSSNTQIRMGSNLVLNGSNIISIGTNGSEKIRIASDGNVGIGTTSPNFKLDNYNDTVRYTLRCSEKTLTVAFPNGVANQKVDVTFDVSPGTNVFWGNFEVEITDGYSNQLATGKLIKVFAVGMNPATGAGPYTSALYDNTSYYTAAYGETPTNYAIDGMFFNTTTGKYYFTIIHRTSTGNTPIIKIRGFGYDANSSINIANLTIGSVYTTDTTTYYKPVVEMPTGRIGYNGNINQSANDFIVSGNVGVGLVAPSTKLHLSSSATAALRIETRTNSAADSEIEFVGPDTHSYSTGIDTSDSNKFKISYAATRTPPTLGTNDRFILTTAGNVGIGSSTPAAFFDVNGTSKFSGNMGVGAAPSLNARFTITGTSTSQRAVSFSTVSSRSDTTSTSYILTGWIAIYCTSLTGITNGEYYIPFYQYSP